MTATVAPSSRQDTPASAGASRLELRLGSAVRSVILAICVLMALAAPAADRAAWAISAAAYGGLALLIFLLLRQSWLANVAGRGLILAGLLADQGLVTWMVYLDGGLGSNLVWLYALLLVRSALLYPWMSEALFAGLTFAPLYAGALYAAAGSLYFLRTRPFLILYGLLFALALACVYAGALLRARQESLRRLTAQLSSNRTDLADKSLSLERAAAELSERVFELRSLQEGIKAISSALALEDVLRLIVDNVSQVLGGSSCYLALAEAEGSAPALATLPLAGHAPLAPAERAQLERVASFIASSGARLLVNDLARDERFAAADGMSAASLVGAPLLVDGRPIGALMATSPAARPFQADHLSLLAAFADQAALAVKNARLYRDLALEQQRTESKSNELEAIVRGIGDGVIVTDAELRLVLINPRAAHIFGLSGQPAYGAPITDLIQHNDLIQLLEQTRSLPDQVAMREIALPPARDQQPVYQALASRLMGAGGQVAGVVTVLRDITGQKELERMKSNFLSVISHELKTPLHSIKGFVDIILMGKTGQINDIQRDFLTTVKEQTAQLQRLINDLLEFSRLESGQIKLHPQELDIASLAAEVMEKLKPLAQEGGVQLVSTLPADFPIIEADRVRLEQVFSNLLDNAIKFTPAGGSITISGEDRGAEVRLRVADTGIGVPPQERERIFDRFYQVDSGSTRHYRGTGLGLTICKHIIEQHQGHIWVEGEEGQGAIFVFDLPKRLSRQEELALDFSGLPTRAGRDRK